MGEEGIESCFEQLLANCKEILPAYQDLSISLSRVVLLSNEEHAVGITHSGLVVFINLVNKLLKTRKISENSLCGLALYSNDAMVVVQEANCLHFVEISSLYSIKSLDFKVKYGNIEKILMFSDELFVYCKFKTGRLMKVETSGTYGGKTLIDNQVIDLAVSNEYLYVGFHSQLFLYTANMEVVYERRIEINIPYEITTSSTSKFYSLHNKYLYKICYKNKLERINKFNIKIEIVAVNFSNDDKYSILSLANSSILILSCPKAVQLLKIPFDAKPCANINISQDQSKLILVSGQKLITIKFPKRSKLMTYYNISELDITPMNQIKTTKDVTFFINSSPSVRYTIQDDPKSYFLRGHQDIVTCVITLNDTTCASGSNDYDIRLWDYRNNTCIGILRGHIAAISSLEVNENWLYSGSYDHTIKVWNWEDCTLFHTINLGSEVMGFVFWKDTLIAGTTGKIYLWDLNNYVLIAYKTLNCEIECLKLEYEGKKIMINAKNRVFIKNPMWGNHTTVWGDGGGYTFMGHIFDLLNGLRPSYTPYLKSFAIFPYKLNIIHFYSYFNMSRNIKSALSDGCGLFNSHTGENPLKISRKSKNLECCSALLNYANKHKFYPLQFKMLNMDEIVQLNLTDLLSLKNLYDLVWLESLTVFPRYASQLEEFPKVFNSDKPTILSLDFFKDILYENSGTEISYFTSVIKIPEVGTWASIRFLESLPKGNKKVYYSDFIEQTLIYKWQQCKWALYVQSILYAAYFFQLIGSIIWISNYEALVITNTLSGIISFIMLTKIVLTGTLTGWHITDIFRTLLIIVYTIESSVQTREEFEFVLILAILLSTMKGLYYFSLFTSTRLMTKSIIKASFKVFSFLFVIFYLLLTLSLLIHYSNYSIASTSLANFNNLYMIFFTFIIFALILGLTSYKYKLHKDLIEINFLLIELEKLMFWKRDKAKEKFFQVCKPKKYIQIKSSSRSIRGLENFSEGHSEVMKKLQSITKHLKSIQTIRTSFNK